MKTYNWEGVNPDGKADGIGSNWSRKYPSGLTPSQLYVFMPPNLGGFFMVRSYYPSECHADYFDFERIEALKPAIEACGISTLSQSPDRKSGSAGMPRPISYAVFCLKKKQNDKHRC